MESAINVVFTSSTAGNASRKELLMWVNETLGTNYTKVENLCTGSAYCRLLGELFPGSLSIKKIKPNFLHLAHESQHNFKLLQAAFEKLSVSRIIPIDRLVLGRFQDNFEFLQWFKRFYDVNKMSKSSDSANDKQKKAPEEKKETPPTVHKVILPSDLVLLSPRIIRSHIPVNLALLGTKYANGQGDFIICPKVKLEANEPMDNKSSLPEPREEVGDTVFRHNLWLPNIDAMPVANPTANEGVGDCRNSGEYTERMPISPTQPLSPSPKKDGLKRLAKKVISPLAKQKLTLPKAAGKPPAHVATTANEAGKLTKLCLAKESVRNAFRMDVQSKALNLKASVEAMQVEKDKYFKSLTDIHALCEQSKGTPTQPLADKILQILNLHEELDQVAQESPLN